MALRIHLKILLLVSLSLLLGLSARAQQTAEDFFHGGAMFYLSNNIPSAKEVVTNGLQRFPDSDKLKKLWELLNQQQQSQNQQQQQQQQQQQEKKPDEQQKQKQSPSEQKEKESKSGEKKSEQPEQMEAHAMTPEEAKKLLDAQKGEEQVLQFRPPDKPKERKDRKSVV